MARTCDMEDQDSTDRDPLNVNDHGTKNTVAGSTSGAQTQSFLDWYDTEYMKPIFGGPSVRVL